MEVFIIGILFYILPFFWVVFFKDKRKGFLYVLFFSSLFHISLGFFTQLLGIFYYSVVVTATGVAVVICLVACRYVLKRYRGGDGSSILPVKKEAVSSKISAVLQEVFQRTDWALLAVILIAVLSLYHVHYRYTGAISMVGDEHQTYHRVENMRYVYPYFSDEWYAVSLIEGAISSGGLPVKNMLTGGSFLNLELFTHSFLAEVMVLLGMKPLFHYTLLSIAINTLIIVLSYLFLRISAVSKPSSAIAALSILYITSGATLPGIWNLIPVTLGILFSLLLFCFIALNDVKMVFLALIPVSLFYPLLAPFYGTAMIVFLLLGRYEHKKKILYGASLAAVAMGAVTAATIVILLFSPFAEGIKYLFSRLWYYHLFGDFVPQLYVFYIVPLPIIFLALLGVPIAVKRYQWIIFPVAVGGIYWISYFFTSYRFILEFERVVFFTSIIIAIMAGFGLLAISEYLNRVFQRRGTTTFSFLQVLCLVFFLLAVPWYTQRERWRNLVAVHTVSSQVAYPRAPANRYLTEDDLRVFDGITGRKFLSFPWKGTVIGVATGNLPIVTKEGTISIGSAATFNSFIRATCQGKQEIAIEAGLEYVYLPSFNCPGFEKVDESGEGLVLYRAR